jgi:hypothetical protein
MRIMNVNKIYDFVIRKIQCMAVRKLDFIINQKCPKKCCVFYIGFQQICETVHEAHGKLHVWPYVTWALLWIKIAENQN